MCAANDHKSVLNLGKREECATTDTCSTCCATTMPHQCVDVIFILKLFTFRHSRLYSKKSKRHVQMVKVAKDYSYIPELQCWILRKRMDGGGLPRKGKRCAPTNGWTGPSTNSQRTGMSTSYILHFYPIHFEKSLKCIYHIRSDSVKSFPVKARSTCIQCCRRAHLLCTLSPVQWIIKHRKFISKLPSSFLSNWHK